MAPAKRNLFLLAFDHRDSVKKKIFGIEGEPDADEKMQIEDAKALVFEAFVAANNRLPAGTGGILIDEEFGADIARRANDMDAVVAMPVERSGQSEFDFEFGDSWQDHIETSDPDYAKVLVRYNPDGDQSLNARQTERLSQLSGWLSDTERRLMFELLVPATTEQIESVGGDSGRFDNELRPQLMRRAVDELLTAGVEPDVWKIEGLESREQCIEIARHTRADGRDHVTCIVLGRGADDEGVMRWLRAGAGVDGYAGFAIGRTIWWDPLRSLLAGRLDRPAAVEAISDSYRSFVDAYLTFEAESQ